MQDTRLVRTSVDGNAHGLVLRRANGDEPPLDELFGLLPDAGPTDVLAVTYEESSRFLHSWREKLDRRPRNFGVVSVGEQMRSASAAGSGGQHPEHTLLRGVADAADTDEIRLTATWYLDAWPSDGRTVAYFDSVSDLLEETDADDAVEFVEEFLRALDERETVGYFTMTPAAHDPTTVSEIAALFDTVVECVDTDVQITERPSISDCFDAMADARRRRVLAGIADGEPVPVDELAAEVAAEESVTRRQVQVSLLNVHLPKLAELGLVAYDRENERVEPGEHFDRVVPYLRKVARHA